MHNFNLFYIFHRYVTHQINVPEREGSKDVVKTIKFHICFLCSNIFLNFSKRIHHRKVQGCKLILRLPIQLK